MSEWSDNQRSPVMADPFAGQGWRETWARAARRMWTAAAAELIVFAPVTLICLVLGTLPRERFRALFAATEATPEMVDQLTRGQPVILFSAAVYGLVLVLPAAILVWLGFRVRRGMAGSALAAQWLMGGQLVFAGLAIVAALSSGQVGMIACQLVLFGGLGALLWVALSASRLARQLGPAPTDEPLEPWNTPVR